MKVADKLLYNGEVKAVPIEQIESSPNYRDPKSQRELRQLGVSMNKQGQITPVLLEEIRDEKNVFYRRLAGERRYLAAKMVCMETLNAKIYTNLTEAERLEIQMIENIKKPIRREELAEQEVYDIVTVLSAHLDEKTREKILSTNDYFAIPKFVREKYPLSQYARDKNTSRRTMNRNFHFSNLHRSIRELVSKDEVSFSIGAEVGRILNKSIQIQLYAKYRYLDDDAHRGRRRNALDFGKIVSLELRRAERIKAEKQELELTVKDSYVNQNDALAKDLERELKKVKLIRGMYHAITIEPDLVDIIKTHTHFETLKTDFENEWTNATNALTCVGIKISSQTNLLREMEESGGKKKTLRDKVLEGELSDIEGDYKAHFNLQGKTEKFPIDELVPDPSNPRKTIDWDYIQELAESMDILGHQLSPIVVRPKEGIEGLMIVVGHMRTLAGKKAGFKVMEGYERELTDFEARLVQIIENYYEKPSNRELANGIAQLFELRKEEGKESGEKITKSQFKNSVKWLNSGLLNSSLAYNSLDELTKNLEKQKIISYGTAVQLARVDGSERYTVTLPIITFNLNAGEAKKYIDNHLAEKNNHVDTSTEIAMFQQQIKEASIKHIKKKLAAKFLMTLIEFKENVNYITAKNPDIFKRENIVEKYYDLNIAWNDLREQIMTIQGHNGTIQ
ncbi:ParB N-terminal domain-containing protein [Candidatus Woesearchaeota archaeon]|nr:ParB N-terminal domain-containing protein [Candidatus Woesearchaeota archaeon]